MQRVLIVMSLFVVAAGTWLGVMENILRHNGYAGRSVIAACIAIQGLATLAILANARSVFRNLIMAGAVGILLLGGSAIFRILRAQHFEGYVLIIGVALVVQGGLTLATLLQARYRKAV